MRVRWLALAFGVLNHALFAAAIASMAAALWTGLALGRGVLHGAAALAADLALVAAFPLLHSALLGRGGGRLLARLFPAPHGRHLVTTSYATVASLQLLVTFWVWSPLGPVLWRPDGAWLVVHAAAFALAWLFLVKAIFDGGMGVQTGFVGWAAVFRGRTPRYPSFAQRGTFTMCRQPIYLAFALVLWTAPTWTLDRFILAVGWTLYCVLGPLLKERRYLTRYGEAFLAYRARTAYFLPTLPRRS